MRRGPSDEEPRPDRWKRIGSGFAPLDDVGVERGRAHAEGEDEAHELIVDKVHVVSPCEGAPCACRLQG